MKTVAILLTGFDAFGGETLNPSWEAIKAYDGHMLDELIAPEFPARLAQLPSDTRYQLHCRRLPCVFGLAAAQLRQHIHASQPELVLAIGQAGGRSTLSIEKVAINLDDARIADNQGQQPIDQSIQAKGPAAYFSNLPVKAIVADWHAAALPGMISYSAGTYVCNHVFYSLMHELSQAQSRCRAGFLHIPFLPEQVCDKPQQASMSLALIQRGILSAILSSLIHNTDLSVHGGATH